MHRTNTPPANPRREARAVVTTLTEDLFGAFLLDGPEAGITFALEGPHWTVGTRIDVWYYPADQWAH
jgi:hypothetical protein